jgi:hypothetical protein
MILEPWEAAAIGDLEALHESFREFKNWDPLETVKWAVYGGNPACLALVHAQGVMMTEKTCVWAAEFGKLECLRYAYAHGGPLSENVYLWAKLSRHEDCMRFIREQLDTPGRKRKRCSDMCDLDDLDSD